MRELIFKLVVKQPCTFDPPKDQIEQGRKMLIFRCSISNKTHFSGSDGGYALHAHVETGYSGYSSVTDKGDKI